MSTSTFRRGAFLVGLVLLVTWGLRPGRGEEGQWPLSRIGSLDLKAKGIEIPASEIWNSSRASLVDAVCRVGGATGSFVSSDGLILTNHHVAFRGVQSISTPENNYLRDGFAAKNKKDERSARGYTCRITVGYRDVSAEVLAAGEKVDDPAARSRAVRAAMERIAKKAEKENDGLTAEVSEMFQGSSYVLFLYQVIRDVRLVCVPPRAVGEYGGEEDNWVWPRHTGDFAFLRAYVAPDGTPAAYSPDNVPFHPKRWLEVNPKGVSEGDAVFLLGYPGRTYRHQSSWFLEVEERIRLPFYSGLFAEEIDAMEDASAKDPAAALALSTEIKGKANVEKNFRGKLLGMKRLGLVQKRRNEELEMMDYIEADPARGKQIGDVLGDLEAIYREILAEGVEPHLLGRLTRDCKGMILARDVMAGAAFRMRPNERRPAIWKEGAEDKRRERWEGMLTTHYEDVDVRILAAILRRIVAVADAQEDSEWLSEVLSWMERHGPEGKGRDALAVARAVNGKSRLFDPAALEELIRKKPEDVLRAGDPFVELSFIIQGPMQTFRRNAAVRRGKLDPVMARYIAARQLYRQEDFCPDANSTLRMTTGHIRGYSPRDAVWSKPFTTLRGVVEKNRGEEPFKAPGRLVKLWESKDFGDYASPDLKDVPVGILYDTDTTGGNSGSPVMDGKGRLVGVNFDRCFEATINDYQWSEDYSRSIGVDIRYVLWVTEKLMNAQWVVKELVSR